MPDILQVQKTENKEIKTYSVKKLWSQLKSFNDMTEQFVFYVPFVHTLVSSTQGTDAFSHTIMQTTGEHPLVITELSRKVFEVLPPLIVPSGKKAFERAIYAAPKEAWNAAAGTCGFRAAVDAEKKRFCIFRMYEEEVSCPFEHFSDKTMKVQYCNLYGNQETYYFKKYAKADGTECTGLNYAPPVQEFVDLGSRILGMFTSKNAAEKNVVSACQLIDSQNLDRNVADIKVKEAVKPKVIAESALTVQQKNDCYEVIRMYKRVYDE